MDRLGDFLETWFDRRASDDVDAHHTGVDVGDVGLHVEEILGPAL